MPLDYLQAAKDYLTSGNTELAIANLTEALKVNPNLAEAHHQLGLIQFQQGKFDDATLCFRRAISLEPQYTDAVYNLGNALAQSGQLAEAIATYKQVIDLQPHHLKAYLNLGVVHFQSQNLGAAVSCYQKALEIDSKNIRAYQSLATIFTDRGMLEKSIDCYQQAIALINNNSAAGERTQNEVDVETNLYMGLANSFYFLKQLEQSLHAYQQALALNPSLPGLTHRIMEIEWALEIRSKISEVRRTVLHVGCGPYSTTGLHLAFQTPEWQEIRFDIDPGVQPDIVGTLTDMSAVSSSSVNAIWSSHNIEHLYPHEVPIALKECYRALKPGGLVLITLPDIQKIAEFVAEGKLETPIYHSSGVGISALDIIYGLGVAIADGNYYMAHRTGFTAETLRNKLIDAGFIDAIVCREGLNLWAKAYKPNASLEELNEKVLTWA
jgi:Tfp pilus assembly protein PilF/SAM-dependent methyltransferase